MANAFAPLIAALALTFIMLTPAQAQAMCGPREIIVSQLQDKYGEQRQGFGLQRGRGVLELYASQETGSWTILVTDPRGQACLMATGEAFQLEDVEAIVPGEDS